MLRVREILKRLARIERILRKRRLVDYLRVRLPDGTTMRVTPLLPLPLVNPGIWTNNSPSAGYVAWAGSQVSHQGEWHVIADGNTNLKYIWWDKDSPTVFQVTDTQPALNPKEDLLICFNDAGTVQLALVSNLIQASLLAAGSAIINQLFIKSGGSIVIGTPTDGISLTDALIVGKSGGVAQFYLDATTGKGYFGAGDVRLDVDGQMITASPTYQPRNTLKWQKDGYDFLQMYATYDGVAPNRNTQFVIKARPEGTGQANIYIGTLAGNQIGINEGTSNWAFVTGVPLRIATAQKPLQFFDSLTEIWEDASSNLSFKDTVAGGPFTLKELVGGSYSSHAVRHQDAGSDEIALTGLEGTNIKVDTIYEKTAAAGVTIDGVLLKDNLIAWSYINKATSNLNEIATRSAGDLSSGNLAIARMPTGGAWTLSSDLNIDANTLVIDQLNDRVGIGTTNPVLKLDVIGAVRIDPSTQNETPLLQFADIFSDYMVAGLLPATSANLTSDISAGQAYSKGKRIYNAAESHTYTASKDTYVDVDYNGNYTFSEVATGAAAPAVAANSIRLAKVMTDADNITSVSDLRDLFLATTVNGSERMRIDSAGNVGIGTTGPTITLDVNGQIRIRGGAPVAGKALTCDANGLGTWETHVNSFNARTGAVVPATDDYTWAQINKATSSLADIVTRSAGDLTSGNLGVARMPTGGAWALSSDLNIDANTLVVDQLNNRVGIGTTGPGAKLTLAKGTGTPRAGAHGLQIYNADATADQRNWFIEMGGAGTGYLHFSQYGDSSGARARLRIDPTSTFTGDPDVVISGGGNVGIGATSPGAKLDVAGDIRTTTYDGGLKVGGSMSFGANNVFSGAEVPLHIYSTSTPPYTKIISFRNNQNSADVALRRIGISFNLSSDSTTSEANKMGALTVESPNDWSNSPSLHLWTGGSQRLTINSTGNVGIGTAGPSTKCDINGQIRIRGGTPAAGKVLTSNADGLATWETPAAGSGMVAHVLATTDGLGAYHTTSGLTVGQVLRASGATTAAFAQLPHDELGGLTDDDHTQYLLANGTRAVAGALVPDGASTRDLGSITAEWANLYIGTGKLYFLADQSINIYGSGTDLKTDDNLVCAGLTIGATSISESNLQTIKTHVGL